mgnify:CR=1 FL=1
MVRHLKDCIRVCDVEKYYGNGQNITKAVDRVSFQVEKGEFVGIMGASGSGKTTLLNMMAAIDHVTSGHIYYDDLDITEMSADQLSEFRKENLGFVFQEYNLLDTLTLEENIILALTVQGKRRKEIQKICQDMMELLEIEDVKDQFPYEVSGGQKQRCACARAMANDPSLLLADEPTGALDSHASQVLLETFCRLNEMQKATILMVTHDMGSIIKYCDKVVLLNKGEFIAEGEPGHMVDLYKKILANQLDSLKEELESDYSGGMLGEEKNVKAEKAHSDGSLMKDKITINTDRTEYGDGRAEIFDLGLFDARGNLTNLLLKGEMFTIRERIRFHAPIKCPIFTYTIRDKKGTDLTGTNTMYEGCDIKPVGDGDVYDVSFTQKMTLQGGEYLLSMSCTGFEGEEHVVYHRLYNIANITVISNKNTVGVYDMESEVETSLTRA